MDFFNDETAYVLQYITFPLEVIGLALATVEVRFPRTSARIVGWVERQVSSLKLVKPSEPTKGESFYFFKSIYFKLARRDGGLTLEFFASLIVAVVFLQIFQNRAEWGEIVFVTALVLGIVLSSVLAFSLKWVPNRVVGTLGIFIAGVGVAGEAYQFTHQLIGV